MNEKNMMEFSRFWDKEYTHPENRGDKLRAQSRFGRIVAQGQVGDLMNALEGYRAYQALNSKWYSPMMLSSWLGSKTSERWREFMTKDEKWQTAFSPLLKESENMERALGIHSEMERRQKYWDLDCAKHIHDNSCQMGKVCYYVAEKRPVVRELDDIMAAIKAEV